MAERDLSQETDLAVRGIAELETTLEDGSGVRDSVRASVAPAAASITDDVNATLQRPGT